MGECGFGFLCGRSIMANLCSEIRGSICISFLVTPPCFAQSCVSSPSQVHGAVHPPGAGVGRWSRAHPPQFENTVAQAASQSSCLTASQTLYTKSKHSSPGKPALNFEYFGDCFATVAIRKLSSLLIDNMSGVYTEIQQLWNESLFAVDCRLHVSSFKSSE